MSKRCVLVDQALVCKATRVWECVLGPSLCQHHEMGGWRARRAQVVLAAVQSPLLAEAKQASVLIPRLCNTILLAPSNCRHVRPWPHMGALT